MYCIKCGERIVDDAVFCPKCGAQQSVINSAPPEGVYSMPQKVPYVSTNQSNYFSNDVSVKKIGFGEAIKSYFKQYATFSGRATRSEFWWIALLDAIVFVFSLIPYIGTVISWVWYMVTLVPGMALCWRRLQDVGKKGTYYFIGFIPIVGTILLLIKYCAPSDGDNQYGPRKI